MNEQNAPRSRGLVRGILLGSMLPVAVIGGFFAYELIIPDKYSLVINGAEKLGKAIGKAQDVEIRESADAQMVQEIALAVAQQLAAQDTINEQSAETMKQAIVQNAVAQDQAIMQAKTETIKGSYSGQILVATVGDLACGLGMALGAPEAMQGCFIAETAREQMSKNMTKELEANRPTGARDVIENLPSDEDFGRDQVRENHAAEIKRYIEMIKNG